MWLANLSLGKFFELRQAFEKELQSRFDKLGWNNTAYSNHADHQWDTTKGSEPASETSYEKVRNDANNHVHGIDIDINNVKAWTCSGGVAKVQQELVDTCAATTSVAVAVDEQRLAIQAIARNFAGGKATQTGSLRRRQGKLASLLKAGATREDGDSLIAVSIDERLHNEARVLVITCLANSFIF